ncbi:hypothetical protein [Halobellus captivus]|nr:hypothetical protein [Halobellus captivus]
MSVAFAFVVPVARHVGFREDRDGGQSSVSVELAGVVKWIAV